MNKYTIEQKIRTTAENAVMSGEKPASFICEGVEFSHEDFDYQEGWLSDFWLAKTTIEEENFNKAYGVFINKLNRIIPRIALISQCYVNFINESFLITKEESDNAFFGLSIDSKYVGLMFQENEQKILNQLLVNDVPENFYKYWNDAVNTTGYSSKLLIMLSALEAISKKTNGKKDWDKLTEILGEELKDKLFERNKGLRNRLVHGEYFSKDDATNFVQEIHKAVIKYFNKQNGDNKINEDVVSPQRSFFENKEGGFWFIKKIGDANIDLKSVVSALDTNNSPSFKGEFDFDWDKNLYNTF